MYFYYSVLLIIVAAVYPIIVLWIAVSASRSLTKSTPVLSPEERPKVLAAAVSERCRQLADPEQLAKFLDGYLGSADAAKKDAWDRCRQDSSYLVSLVVDDLSRRSDEQLAEILLGGKEPLPSEIDLVERLKQHRAAQEVLTPRQTIAAIVGAAVLGLMFLFPPFVRTHDDITWFMFAVQDYRVIDVTFLGYRPIFAPGMPKDEFQEVHTGDLGKVRFNRTQHAPYIALLAMQATIAIISAAGAVKLLKKNPS